jgi:hypothetical protein
MLKLLLKIFDSANQIMTILKICVRKRGGRVMEKSISWGELAQLTHKTQVEQFGFCTCEDNEGNENPYLDCTGDGQ